MFDKRNSDRGDELFDDHDEPRPGGGLDLFKDAMEADGDLTRFTRERPNGRFVEDEPPDTGFGVDRNQSGQFASKDRDPVPQNRGMDGRLKLDPFAVGNENAFKDLHD